MSRGVELSGIVRELGPRYRETHRLSRGQSRALRAIELCRTPALGGHRDRCPKCGHEHLIWHSCRNRHCPKCQFAAREKWLAERKSELLPVPYFHVVFTLPDILNPLVLTNHRLIYDLLFRATRDTLLTIAADPKHLGARIGFLAVLHTWGQTLTLHPHLHCVVPAGGFSPDGTRWIRPRRKRFLLPVRVLSCYFRGRFLVLLRDAIRAQTLRIPDSLDLDQLNTLIDQAARKEWVVYAKRPFGGPAQVLAYLARYTHRIAISNARLLSFHDRKVTFRWKDYRHGNRPRLMTLTGDEFLRRFLLHVLPDRFVRIRHFGFFANRVRGASLAKARQLLGVPHIPDVPPSSGSDSIDVPDDSSDDAPEPTRVCPQCHQSMMITIEILQPGRPPPQKDRRS